MHHFMIRHYNALNVPVLIMPVIDLNRLGWDHERWVRTLECPSLHGNGLQARHTFGLIHFNAKYPKSDDY
jgi:hypothetical protein